MAAQSSSSRPAAPAPGAGMAGSFRLFRLFGIDVYIHWSWLFIFAMVTWSIATGHLPTVYPDWTAQQRWVIGAITAALFFGSVLAHEISHSLQARRRGVPVNSITLFLFGGVSALASEPRNARDEFWIAIVGPLTSFAAAVLFGVVLLIGRAADIAPLTAIGGYLTSVNVAVGVFNLLPGFPLDGGRVLRAVVWGAKRNLLEATRIAGNAGRVLAGVMIAAGVLSIFAGGNLGGLWFVFLGWFLWNAAEGSYQQLLLQTSLQGLQIGPLIEREVLRVTPTLTLRQLAHDIILRQNQRAFFVAAVDQGEILGLITLSDVRAVPQDAWDTTTVYRAMTPRDRLVTATPDMDAMAVMQLMAEHNVNQLVILEQGEPIGILTRAALIGAIRLRNEVVAGRR